MIKKECRVSQLAVGFKVKEGKVTKDVAIVAFVKKKKPLANVSENPPHPSGAG
ncbi:MAG: hypothetical protein ACUVTD_06545 [Nitrososphaerales archaeon]